MKFLAMLFSLLLLASLTSTAHAHPVTLGVTVQDQDGLILFNSELKGYGKNSLQPVQQIDGDGSYDSFIWMVAGTIAASIMSVAVITFREEIFAKTFKANVQ